MISVENSLFSEMMMKFSRSHIDLKRDCHYKQTQIYINGELLGYSVKTQSNSTQELGERKEEMVKSPYEMNITYYEDSQEIYIFNDPGRARRPLIIVPDGVPLFKRKRTRAKCKW